MNKDVVVPLVFVGGVMLLASGRITSFRDWLSNWLNGNGNPFESSQNPLAPVTVGQGGDVAIQNPGASGITGEGVQLAGTVNGNMFNTSGILSFPYTPAGSTQASLVTAFSPSLVGSFQLEPGQSPTAPIPIGSAQGYGGGLLQTALTLIGEETPAQVAALQQAEDNK